MCSYIHQCCSTTTSIMMILRVSLLSSLNPTVLAIYSISGGKAGKHFWVSNSSNVAAVSNIPVQLFDHILGVQFQAISGGQTLHVKRFCLLPSSAFLCTLDAAPSETDNRLKISPQDGMLFHNLKDSSASMQKAVTSLAGRGEKAKVLNDTDEEFED